MDNQLLINKYKPYTINDFYGQEESKIFLRNMMEFNNVNFLLIGNSGYGKTTFLEAFVKDYFSYFKITNIKNNFLFINQSKEQGINFFKNDIKLFCQSNNNLHKFKKLLVIDNLDTIPDSSQHILRSLMDSYSKHVLFIASAVVQQKIISALQSRFITHFLSSPKQEDFSNITNHIINLEKIDIQNPMIIKSIVFKSNNSFRKLINSLDKLRLLNVKITSSLCTSMTCDINDSLFQSIFDFINIGKLEEACASILNIPNLGYSNIDIFESFYEFIKCSELEDKYKLKIIPIICQFISNYYIHYENRLDLVIFVNKIYKSLRSI